MTLRLLTLFRACLGLVMLNAAAVGAEEKSFRVIRGTVLDLDGSPAPGREVLLIGLSRGSSRSYESTHGAAEFWNFRTDGRGQFTARLGEFKTWEDPLERPGWGTYVFVVSAERDDAGAVSPHLSSVPRGDTGDFGPADEWGPCRNVPSQGLDLTLQVQAGLTLTGRVVAWPDGKTPLAGLRVFTHNDLYSESHTSHGGEILERSAETDAGGRFTITHIYPVRFYVGLGAPRGLHGLSDDPGCWLKTRLPDGRWTEDVLDVLAPPAHARAMTIEIMATAKPAFRYHGLVTAAHGAPIAGAKVAFGVSFHPRVSTFEDDHTYLSAVTGRDGSYEILLPSPWVRGMDAEAAGYARSDRWDDSDAASFPPGEYDFTLQRQAAP